MGGTTRRTAAAVLAAGALAWTAGRLPALAIAADPHAPRAAAGQAAAGQSAVALAGAALVQQQQLAQAAQAWQQQLANLAAEARRQGDGGLLIVITQVNGELQSVSLFPATAAGFVAALQASESALALWRNRPPASGGEDQPELQDAERGAADLSTAEETGFAFAADLTSGATWKYDAGPGADGPAAGGPGSAAADDPPQAAAPGGEEPRDGAAPEELPLEGGTAGDPAQGAVAGDADEAGAAGTPDSPGSGWIVVHGGPASGWSDETEAPAGDPDFALQLGEMDDSSPLDADADRAALAGDGASAAAPSSGLDGGEAVPPAAEALLSGSQVCRAWQPPPASAASCLLRSPLIDRF